MAANDIPKTSCLRQRKNASSPRRQSQDSFYDEEPESLLDMFAEDSKQSELLKKTPVAPPTHPSEYSAVHNWAISTIDKHFRHLAVWAVCTYITLVSICYLVVPTENIIKLEGAEQRSANLAAWSLGASLISWMVIPNTSDQSGKQSTSSSSGIFIGAITVQMISFVTDILLAYYPTPLLIDPVLGTRVHVLRWCGWCPCAAFMTFMVEGADMYWQGEEPPRDYMKKKYIHAATQGGAVFLGLLFPFCPGVISWMVCMVVACCLYLTNFPRMWSRRRDIPRTLPSNKASIEESERYNSARSSLKLRYITVGVWSMIVVLYFVSSVIGPKFAPEGSMLRSPSANMTCECLFDVISKVLFLRNIVDVHNAIFDENMRAQRRLDNLSQLMQMDVG